MRDYFATPKRPPQFFAIVWIYGKPYMMSLGQIARNVTCNSNIGRNLCSIIWTCDCYCRKCYAMTIGYLVIQSPMELDIDAVYTAEVPGGPDSQGLISPPTGISIDVERVPGKRVSYRTRSRERSRMRKEAPMNRPALRLALVAALLLSLLSVASA